MAELGQCSRGFSSLKLLGNEVINFELSCRKKTVWDSPTSLVCFGKTPAWHGKRLIVVGYLMFENIIYYDATQGSSVPLTSFHSVLCPCPVRMHSEQKLANYSAWESCFLSSRPGPQGLNYGFSNDYKVLGKAFGKTTLDHVTTESTVAVSKLCQTAWATTLAVFTVDFQPCSLFLSGHASYQLYRCRIDPNQTLQQAQQSLEYQAIEDPFCFEDCNTSKTWLSDTALVIETREDSEGYSPNLRVRKILRL